MYALSQGRPKPDDDEDDNRPRVPERRATHHESTEILNSETSSKTTMGFSASGGVAAAMRAARVSKSSSRNDLEDEAEVEDYAEDIDDVIKPGKPKAATTTVGAVAVPGSTPQMNRSIATYNSHTYQDSFINRSAPTEQGQPMMPNKNEPIVARRVADDEADIEAQVQSRMNAEAKEIADMVHKQLIANAVIAEAQPSVQDTSSLTATQDHDEQTLQKQKRLCIIVIAILATIAVIGAAVGVAVSNTREPSTDSSPPAEQCSFCYDGSTPPNLKSNEVLGRTCEDYHQDQILLDSTDSNCMIGQAVAAALCECPTFPPRPENPTCTMCENGATPSGLGCFDVDTLIQHLGGSPLFTCNELIASALENGCTCVVDSANPIEPFQTLLEPLSGDALNDQDSPQFRALYWIAKDDPANLSVGSTMDSIIENRYVAAVVYYAFAGESWTDQYNFLSQDDICSWKRSDMEGIEHGIVCDSGGNVETLRLPENKLFGSLPPELAFFSGLMTIEMAFNTISGALPSSLSKLSRLEYIDFSENQLTGLLPEYLFFTNRQLKRILLDDNRFSGTINHKLGLKLEFFWMANNQLTGLLPSSLGQSSTLVSVDLKGNQLGGTIPDFSPSSRLFYLGLSQNDILGTLPSTIGVASQLESLELYDNFFTGTLPSELGKCLGLLFMDVDNNLVTGAVDTVIDSLPHSIEYFNIGANLLEGPIPASIGSLTNLDFVDAWGNRLTGTIASEFGQLSKLEVLDLESNKLTGTVPTSIASLPRLDRFNVVNNDLTGSLDTFCANDYSFFVANACDEDKIECSCCTHCCNPGEDYCYEL